MQLKFGSYLTDFSPFTVSRLREQWDETSNCVMKRKSELLAMLGDSQRLLFMS